MAIATDTWIATLRNDTGENTAAFSHFLAEHRLEARVLWASLMEMTRTVIDAAHDVEEADALIGNIRDEYQTYLIWAETVNGTGRAHVSAPQRIESHFGNAPRSHVTTALQLLRDAFYLNKSYAAHYLRLYAGVLIANVNDVGGVLLP